MRTSGTHAGTAGTTGDPPLVRANKLELVERLADDLAHEIKNPLHSMVINLEVLKRRIARSGGTEPDELLRYVGVLGGELERVNRRVELLLRMLRPDRGSEPATLEEVLDELLELLDLERERRGVQVSYHPGGNALRGNLPREAARQMVLNLLVDTLDLLPPGGTLRIRTETDGSVARLRIDGIAGAERFPAGVDGSTRLSIVRTLGEEIGGHLEVTSAPPTESDPAHATFSVVLSLPLATH